MNWIHLGQDTDQWQALVNTITRIQEKSRDSSVDIALGYGLDDLGSRFRFPVWAGKFLITTACRTALGPTQPRIQWVPGALSLGVKRAKREADHSLPSSSEVKECVELYLHSPNTPSWRCAQLKAQGQIYLYKSGTFLDRLKIIRIVAKLKYNLK
jgi:hypothetical protein